MKHLKPTPATEQLEWALDALAGGSVTEADAASRLGAQFQARLPAAQWISTVNNQAPAIRPFTLTSFKLTSSGARAELETPVGSIVVVCDVDAEGKIDALNIINAGVGGLTPRLPMTFVPRDDGREPGQRLIIVAGVPGTGKSTLADRLGRHLATPVFALDWLLGALTPFGGRGFERLGDLGEELLTTLAYRQLDLGQSAIIDTPGENVAMRVRWESLAASVGADVKVIVCTCSDDAIHRQRLTGRKRGIPGWHDGGNWAVVKPRRDAFAPWTGDHVLTLDAVRPPDDTFDEVVQFLGATTRPADPA